MQKRYDERVEKNVLEIYKMYVQHSENLAERRRGYSAMFLPLTSALLVGPYVTKFEDRPVTFMLSIAASVVGVIVCRSWALISARYRGIILHRGRWLGAMEHFLRTRHAIPKYAKVFSFENDNLFNPLKNDNSFNRSAKYIRPSFSLSEVEMSGARTFFFLFLLSPLLPLLFMHMDTKIYPALTTYFYLYGAMIVGLFIFGFKLKPKQSESECRCPSWIFRHEDPIYSKAAIWAKSLVDTPELSESNADYDEMQASLDGDTALEETKVQAN